MLGSACRAAARLGGLVAASGSGIMSSGAIGVPGSLCSAGAPSAAAAAAAAWRRARPYTTTPTADEAWQSLRQTFTSIEAEVGDDGVAVLTLDRPQALNALNSKASPRACRGAPYVLAKKQPAWVLVWPSVAPQARGAPANSSRAVGPQWRRAALRRAGLEQPCSLLLCSCRAR